jgi:exopolysaccharide biosynthesis polyprenyl glycosylphosphotransferase
MGWTRLLALKLGQAPVACVPHRRQRYMDRDRVFSPRVARSRAQRRARLRGGAQVARGTAGPAFLVESRSHATVWRRERVFRRALVGADLVAGLLVVGLASRVFGAEGPGLTALALLPLIVVINATSGLYNRDELLLRKSTLDEIPAVFQAATLTTVVAFLLESAVLETPMGARLFAFTWSSLSVIAMACRVAARAIARQVTPPERCLLIGDGAVGERLEVKLAATTNVKATYVGRIPLDTQPDSMVTGVLGTAEDLPQVVLDHDVHRVIIAGDAGEHQRVLDAIQGAKALGVRVSVLPRMFEAVGSSAAFDYLDGMTVLGVPRFGLSPASRRVKRAFDVAGSALGLVFLAPFLLAIAVAIKLTSLGPVLFRQTRIGRDGQPFEMLKFRTMHDGADAQKTELWPLNEADGLFKIADDPRITRVGRFLRRTSLDELPQLYNVMRGQMSLVGPRPLVVDEDRRIQGWYRRRLSLTPGMTGDWQVFGAARIPLREMATIDYLYVSNWSLWADFKILLRTIPFIVARRGQ